ncbi:discs large homolog 1-like protein isoform X17 [Tachysurus ichikawai]
MNYIFGGNTLYSRGSRAGSTSSAHGSSVGPRLRQWSMRSSCEEPAEPNPSRWRRIFNILTRLNAFTNCVIARVNQCNANSFSFDFKAGETLICTSPSVTMVSPRRIRSVEALSRHMTFPSRHIVSEIRPFVLS